jgi:uncharacterized GH25 family protein
MSSSAQGIVGKAALFKGVVRTNPIEIVLVNEADEPVANAKCKISFANAQTIEVNSDGKGVIKFYRKASGKFEIKLLEE